ncbi:hypothetical protein Tco_0324026 [Tanacetum coccineum]
MAKAASASTTERKFMLLQLTILSHSSNALCDTCPSSCTHFKIFYVVCKSYMLVFCKYSDHCKHEENRFVYVKLTDIRKDVQCPICLGIMTAGSSTTDTLDIPNPTVTSSVVTLNIFVSIIVSISVSGRWLWALSKPRYKTAIPGPSEIPFVGLVFAFTHLYLLTEP